jgi:hypothetical protein
LKPSAIEVAVDRNGDAVRRKWDASENAIIKSKMQLVCNAVNTDSNELDRFYPESIDN